MIFYWREDIHFSSVIMAFIELLKVFINDFDEGLEELLFISRLATMHR